VGRRAARTSVTRLGAAALTAVAVIAVGAAPAAAHATPAGIGPPRALTVDGLRAPIGLGPTDVQFAWQVNDPRPGARQTAYRIVVTRVALIRTVPPAPVWDSGEIASSDQAFIPYGGPPLAADAVYQWTVQTWAALWGPGMDPWNSGTRASCSSTQA
jgi:alpha-L-rhamnosidase